MLWFYVEVYLPFYEMPLSHKVLFDILLLGASISTTKGCVTCDFISLFAGLLFLHTSGSLCQIYIKKNGRLIISRVIN